METSDPFFGRAREILDRLDPIGLLQLGAPRGEGEYDCIAELAAETFAAGADLAAALDGFDEPHFGVTTQPGEFGALTRDLEHAWRDTRPPAAT